MNRLVIVSILLTLMGCGGASRQALIIGSPNNSSSSVGSQALKATMTSSGTGTPGTWTILATGKLVIPAPDNFMVLADTSDAWQVNLIVNSGAQSCNFSHAAGATTITAGTGCTVTTSYILVNVGDVISLSIASGVSQTASVGVTLSETN